MSAEPEFLNQFCRGIDSRRRGEEGPENEADSRARICNRLWSPGIDQFCRGIDSRRMGEGGPENEADSRARICNRLWSPGIDSEKSIPPTYVARRACTNNRVVVLGRLAETRFLGPLNGLQIRAQL